MSDTPPESTKLDREINLKAVFYSAVGLVGVTILSLFGMWWMLRGLASYDLRHDVKPTAIEEANPQPPPPEPRLQVAPGFNLLDAGQGGKALELSDREDMAAERRDEDRILAQPVTVDEAQGLARVPIDVAMRVIASRGVAPEVVGGRAGTSPPEGKKP